MRRESRRRGRTLRTDGSGNARGGYALIAVIWIVFGVGALSLSMSVAAREAIGASRNRTALTQAGWAAEGCLARVRAMLDSLTAGWSESRGDALRRGWNHLPEAFAAVDPTPYRQCSLDWRANGDRLDVNDLNEGRWHRLLTVVGAERLQADSMAAAVADWIDGDDTPRPLGVEAPWYAFMGRTIPGNRPFESVAQLRHVRGFESLEGLDALLTVESGPVSVNQASAAVLSTLPGFGPEAIFAVLGRRRRGELLSSYADLSASLSPEAARAIERAMPTLTSELSLDPTAWVLTLTAGGGVTEVNAIVEVQLRKSGSGITIVRHRAWVE